MRDCLSLFNIIRNALESLLRMKEFESMKCSVSQCIDFIKLMDLLYGEEADSISFYVSCLEKVSFEFNPFNGFECVALNGLLPQTFNSLLVNSRHLQKSMIEVAILKYKELNYNKYRNQLKAFNFTTIWNQRRQICRDDA